MNEHDDEPEDGERPLVSANGTPPRSTAAEIDRRVSEMISFMTVGGYKTRREVVAFAVESFGVSVRQADNYMAKATAQLREDISADQGDARAEIVACLRDRYKAAVDTADVKGAVAVLKEISKLLGLYLDGKPTAPKLTPDQAVAALMVKMRGAKS